MLVPAIFLLFWVVLLSWLPACAASLQPGNAPPPVSSSDRQRQYMIQHQIRGRGIRDEALLQAMSTVPRHLFVNPAQAHLAYEDYPLPIGHNQTISQPYIVAYMTEAAQISPQDKVLEIGTGSGYQAAILGELAKEVYTVEIQPELASRASQTLKKLGYTNVFVREGDGYQGWAEHAPYDAILVTAAPERVPQPLIEQLATGGKLVIPVGKWYQDMLVMTKTSEGIIEERTIAVRFVPLRRNLESEK